jgi:hypothetical protein
MERLLTSWLFWLAMLAIALWLAIGEAYFPRHIPEAKLELQPVESPSGTQK